MRLVTLLSVVVIMLCLAATASASYTPNPYGGKIVKPTPYGGKLITMNPFGGRKHLIDLLK